jgi:hypothetical protein
MTAHPRHPVYSPITFVQNIAKVLADESADGACPDAILHIRVAEAMRERPDVIDYAFIARRLVKHWHAVSNKISNQTDGGYVATLFVKVGKGVSFQMKQMTIPELQAWDDTNAGIVTRFNTTMAQRHERIMTWIRELTSRRDLPTLGDVQRVLHGYVEKLAEDPFALMPALAEEDSEDE